MGYLLSVGLGREGKQQGCILLESKRQSPPGGRVCNKPNSRAHRLHMLETRGGLGGTNAAINWDLLHLLIELKSAPHHTSLTGQG